MISELDDISRSLPFEQIATDKGEFSAHGIRGQVTISWQPTAPQDEPRSSQLDVVGTITVSVDERVQEVRSQGVFVVRSFGGPIDRFRLRIPPGFRLREAPAPRYSVNQIEEANGSDEEGQLVEVVVDRGASNEAQIRVLAELPTNGSDSDSSISVDDLIDRPVTFQPARFTVLGAVRHRGVIDFSVKGDWKLQWDENPNISRIDSPSATFDESEAKARFRYSSQPCDLQVAIRQKATRIYVEPSYEFLVDSQQLRMSATFSCTISGAKAHPLALRLRGWTVESLRFEDVASPVPVDLNVVDPLVVPTPPDAQTAGAFTLKLEARRSLTAGVISGTQPLQVTIPHVEAFNPARAELLVTPANVTVIPAVNVALTPREQDMQALVSTMDPSGSDPASSNPRRFRYRDRGEQSPPSL